MHAPDRTLPSTAAPASRTFADAWALYRAAEVRCPKPRPAPPPERVSGLGALLARDRYDAFLLDAWGVLNLGDVAIPPAREAFRELRRRGLPLRLLSNDAGCDAEDAARRHTRRGFELAPEEIIFGLDLLGATLTGLGVPPEACALVAPRPAPRAELTARMVDVHSPGAEACDAVVFLSTVGYDTRTHARLTELLTRRPRPLLVGNPDIVSPGPAGIAPEPGLYAHRLADALGIEPLFLGKPFPDVYRRALASLPGIDPSRVLCVGDTLHTDVLGASAASLDSLLVESGFFRGEDALARCAEASIRPTYVAATL